MSNYHRYRRVRGAHTDPNPSTRPLADIPNEDGYEVTMILKDISPYGVDRRLARVHRDPETGCYYLRNVHTGDRLDLGQYLGWFPTPPSQW